jgi:tRNA-specific 2-thiouridylase
LAQYANLPNASKKDSTGICFVDKRNHGAFLYKYIAPTTAGSRMLLQCINIDDGRIVATVDAHQHPALLYATIEQGAKLSGATQKWFVVDKMSTKDDNNYNVSLTLMLFSGTHHPSLYSDTLFFDARFWVVSHHPNPFCAKRRIRHMQPLVDCEIYVCSSNKKIDFSHQNRGGRQYIVHLATPSVASPEDKTVLYIQVEA